ncbi:MAG: EAL domain-containing protein [Candidatus Thiodiazotropha sp. (ex. Lucinisca nassula)]|nr:EAL domain-containing protein [Candidatus Thiodiazotropha sp. (ex. Lucinisca nassula)]MBW9270656.1 EAL domain-containing protein [Candidatus Thiodiazotropha sp. (ex. Lucinisca nassula)]
MIGRSFVKNILVDDIGLPMVKTIIEMDRNLGPEVVAEGVANEQQFELLKSRGCNRFQGYWNNRPFPLDQADTLLKKRKHEIVHAS